MDQSQTEWSKDAVFAAAEKADSLSALLESANFYKANALKWLTIEHVEKFLSAMDDDEADKLLKFADGWHYSTNPIASSGVTLLDSIAAIPSGSQLLERLVIFKPTWIARWWKYNHEGNLYNDDILTKASVLPLTAEEFTNHEPEFTDDIVVAIIRRRGDLLDNLDGERLCRILSLAVCGNKGTSNLPAVLYGVGLPADAASLIDAIVESGDKSKLLDHLNQVVSLWKNPQVANPVVQMIVKGHVGLDSILRLPWIGCVNPSKNRFDLWADGIYGHLPLATIEAATVVPERFRLELGFSVGIRIANSQAAPSIETVDKMLESLGIKNKGALVDAVFPMAQLWSSLSTLAKHNKHSWEHRTELVGLCTKISFLAASAPSLWAQALEWILIRQSDLGEVVQAVTLELSLSTPEVHRALEDARSSDIETIRLKAEGLLSLLHGLEEPVAGVGRMLADAAAHYLDGIPIFPHPLMPVSATWLGSAGVESTIASGVRRACARFATDVHDQGGDIEEALTKALVKEIEVEFRDVHPRLKVMGKVSAGPSVPLLSVRQRPASKTSEEPIYGCDIGWLLNGTVHGRYKATWAELVQVKKSMTLQGRRKTKPRLDSWRIDVKQLGDILDWSATATYWLIAAEGEILVVPAKHLAAIIRGREGSHKQKTVTVGYHEVRSAAIPLEQYFVDLLIGQWVGTSSEKVIQFAQGEHTNIRPRVVVEVTISVDKERQ